ncbi:MAG: hypothetical protein ACLT63_00625 [Bacteroides xylanisolvens]
MRQSISAKGELVIRKQSISSFRLNVKRMIRASGVHAGTPVC